MESLKIVAVATVCFILFLGTQSYSAEIPALRDAKDSAEKTRVQSLLDGAAKENALDWIANMIEPQQADYIIAGFKEYYGLPRLKHTYAYGVSTEMIGRIDQILKAGRVPPDITWMPAWDWYTDLIKLGRAMRYDSPYYKEYTLSNESGNSKPGYWVSDFNPPFPLWNVKALEKRGIKNFNPTSWWDFVDPKFSEAICLSNSSVSNAAVSWVIGLRKVLADDWFIKFGKLKPALWTKTQQGETWVASGEYPIALQMRPKQAQRFEESGVEVRAVWPKEGVVLAPYSPIIFATAPHPNTAKLFIDYVRSAPGTNRMAESGAGLLYGRPGVKYSEKDKKFIPPAENIKAITVDWEKDTSTENLKAAREWSKKVGVGY